MRMLNRLSVRTKLYAGFAIVSAALLVAVAVGWMSMLSVSDTVQKGYNRAVVAQETSKVAYNMRVSQAQSAALGHAIKNPDGSDMHAGDVAAFQQQVNQLAALATAPEDHAAVAQISAQFKKWSALDQKVMSLWKAGDSMRASRSQTAPPTRPATPCPASSTSTRRASRQRHSTTRRPQLGRPKSSWASSSRSQSCSPWARRFSSHAGSPAA